jgi:methionine-rich copper-binding protein CopC
VTVGARRRWLFALVVAGLTAVPATALGASIRSSPAAGATLSRVPPRVSVQFADPQARSSHLEVVDPCGKRADQGRSDVAGSTVTVALAATASGRYVVGYFGISAVDGSSRRGSFAFRVEGVEGCRASDVPPGTKPGRGIWDLPKGDFAIALGVAAVIGALGGLVYAAILGPRA